MKTVKIQYIQPRIKMIQMGNSGEFFMESGPGANDQTDPTKGNNPAKEFGDNEETFGYQPYSVWED